jgi:transglutaminase-like putative cysteine protease
MARGPTLRSATTLQWLAMALLAVGLVRLPLSLLLTLLAILLTGLTALKLREARTLPERRLVGLLQLLSVGVLAALQPDLASSLLQGLTTLVILTGLLALEIDRGSSWRELLRRSLVVLAAALPLTLTLFLLLPRLGPLTPVPRDLSQYALTGLNDRLDPGALSSLVDNPAPAARVQFLGGTPPARQQRYWRVLVHEGFDGRSWLALDQQPAGPGTPLLPTGGPRQLWLAEPSGLEVVPWGGTGRPLGTTLRPSPRGELYHRERVQQRRVYALGEVQRQASWQQQPPTVMDLQLPRGANPRLEALADRWAAAGPASRRLEVAEQWFRRQPFRYTRHPEALPERAPLDQLLFQSKEGFCGHYASAFTVLMRAAGVPARVVSGYQGGQWVQPIGGQPYLNLRQSDAHAWSEVWLEGEGWRRVDPSRWVAPDAGDSPPELAPQGPLVWLQQQWWGLDLAWTSLWLGFDRQSQEALLQRLFGTNGPAGGVVLLGLLAIALALGLAGLRWWQGRVGTDPWRRELERGLAPLARRGLTPLAGESLSAFSLRVIGRWPGLADALTPFVAAYQQHRFAAPGAAPSLGQLRRLRRRLVGTLHRLPR